MRPGTQSNREEECLRFESFHHVLLESELKFNWRSSAQPHEDSLNSGGILQ